MPLDLLFPALPLPQDAPATLRAIRLPALEKWLARGAWRREPPRGAVEWLAGRFGVESRAPVAAIALAGEGSKAEGAWLRADPVHLRIDTGQVRLHGPAALEVEAAEAHALVGALQAHFVADGLEFRELAPDRWYLRVARHALPRTTPLAAPIGRDVYALMPEGGGAFNWRAALTQAPMLAPFADTRARWDPVRHTLRAGENAHSQTPPPASRWRWLGRRKPLAAYA